MQDAYGLEGVALASTLALALYTLALAVIWYRRAGTLGRGQEVVDGAMRATPVTVPAAFAA
ncbi:MAG: murein biosynthesis integral membrane protein MurJ, partial [Actinobacteria bacterium]|nr:murein biosynthesis integral membrane protein MurJ [Actinomycetota bacterium]NIV54746.1 murein biosynthesis integral membrane protein MurJ [Actinomycetota bacterium]